MIKRVLTTLTFTYRTLPHGSCSATRVRSLTVISKVQIGGKDISEIIIGRWRLTWSVISPMCHWVGDKNIESSVLTATPRRKALKKWDDRLLGNTEAIKCRWMNLIIWEARESIFSNTTQSRHWQTQPDLSLTHQCSLGPSSPYRPHYWVC